MRAGDYSSESHLTETFRFMKSGTTYREVLNRSLEILNNSGIVIGYAIPLGSYFENNYKLIEKLVYWRNTFEHVYPTRFQVTQEGTARWLKAGVIDNENRLLFLIQDLSG